MVLTPGSRTMQEARRGWGSHRQSPRRPQCCHMWGQLYSSVLKKWGLFLSVASLSSLTFPLQAFPCICGWECLCCRHAPKKSDAKGGTDSKGGSVASPQAWKCVCPPVGLNKRILILDSISCLSNEKGFFFVCFLSFSMVTASAGSDVFKQ